MRNGLVGAASRLRGGNLALKQRERDCEVGFRELLYNSFFEDLPYEVGCWKSLDDAVATTLRFWLLFLFRVASFTTSLGFPLIEKGFVLIEKSANNERLSLTFV